MDNLIPTLYLKGVSSGDFSAALAAILGEQAAGLSATNVVRLKKIWEAEYEQWTQRDLSGKRLATADGALGFWAALREVYPAAQEQTCWFHKAGNVLDKLPQAVQGRAKTMLREMWQAPSLEHASSAYDQFCTAWETKYPKAVACLRKDEAALFGFYGFPAAHWTHICEPATRSSRPTRRCGCGRSGRRGAGRGGRR